MIVGRFTSPVSSHYKPFSVSKCLILELNKTGNYCIILHLLINIRSILSYLMLEQGVYITMVNGYKSYLVTSLDINFRVSYMRFSRSTQII